MHCIVNKSLVNVNLKTSNSQKSKLSMAAPTLLFSDLKNIIKNLVSKVNDFNIIYESKNEGDIIQQSPVWARATITGLMGSAVFAIGWLGIAKTDEVVTVTGKLEPIGSVKEIQMPMGGIASEILVSDGTAVKAGDIVVKLDGETTQQKLISLEEMQKLKVRQLELKEIELEQYLLLNSEEEDMLTNNLDLQNQILASFKFLQEEGAAAQLQYLQELNKVSELTGQLKKVRVDRIRQKAAQNQQIQQLKAELENIESSITETSVSLRYQSLRSPVDGIVFDLQPRSEGYVAQSTETLMKIVPYDTLQASVEIPSNQIGFVKVGMLVDLSIDSFPANDFGSIEGKIKSIGSDALPPNQQVNRLEYKYPAVISMNDQQLILNNGKNFAQVGMASHQISNS